MNNDFNYGMNGVANEQMDVPPELGQIDNLTQSNQFQAPSLDPLDNNLNNNIDNNVYDMNNIQKDALDTYEKTGTFNAFNQSITQPQISQQDVFNSSMTTSFSNNDMGTPPMQNHFANIGTSVQQPQMQNDFSTVGMNVQPPMQNDFTNVGMNVQSPMQNDYPNVGMNAQPSMQNDFANVGINIQPPMSNDLFGITNQSSYSNIGLPSANNFNKESYLVNREEHQEVQSTESEPLEQEDTQPNSEENQVVNLEESEISGNDEFAMDEEESSNNESDGEEDLIDESEDNNSNELEEHQEDIANEESDTKKDLVKKIKTNIEELKSDGNKIDIEEFDFEDMYQLVIKIMK